MYYFSNKTTTRPLTKTLHISDTAEASALDCATYTCRNKGTCDSASGQISCLCAAGIDYFRLLSNDLS